MKLKAKFLDLQAGGRKIAVLDDETASFLGLHATDRVKITYKDKCLIAILNTSSNFSRNQVGLYQETAKELGVIKNDYLDLQPAAIPESLGYVQAKIHGERLREAEMKLIVKDVVERHLSDIELASFVTAIHIHGITMDEIEFLSKAMIEIGSKLTFGKNPILDKHSIGGIPGDKTSILIVPIVAAAGFIIPKSSSRAVTSPAGTADRVETLCPVNLSIKEIKAVVKKTNGCMVWGGALDLAPADDIFIQVEYPLAIDPLLLPSIMSKKKAMNASHVIIDIPTGSGSKIKTIGEASSLAYDFIDLGKRLDMNIECVITFGEQPIGYAIGPALEAREALSAIMGNGPVDLKEKAKSIVGVLFDMVGVRHGKQKAANLLKSGKAEKKLREIIEAQGGNPKIKPEDIKIGDKKIQIKTNKEGQVLRVDNKDFAKIARQAGAPKEKGAGVLLKIKLGERVKKGNVLFEIYSERSTKLQAAYKLAKELQPITLSKKPEERMLIKRIPTKAERIWHQKFELVR